jgi:Xaa-Pro aminopeptidase
MNQVELLNQRRSTFSAKANQQGAQGAFVIGPENRFYLSGFTGSTGWLFVTPKQTYLVADGRYWAQAEQQCPEIQLIKFIPDQDIWWGNALVPVLQALAAESSELTFGFESNLVAFSEHAKLVHLFEQHNLSVKLIPSDDWCETQRQIKHELEMTAMKTSARIADRAFRAALEIFKAGIRERDFCTELEYQMAKGGARKPSFDSIVASGPNGAHPHAGVTDRVIQTGELVTVDFGALKDGYCSDVTRTIWLGNLDSLSKDVYQVVRRSHLKALQAVRPGISCQQLDQIARDVVQESQFKGTFKHGLGHGVGLAVHEKPSVRGSSTQVLEPGMVITIEPGVYLAEGFAHATGSRVEDSVLVTETGFEYITQSRYQELGQSHPLEREPDN